jgi:steroid delta-isomerase-like uncharacterized protein
MSNASYNTHDNKALLELLFEEGIHRGDLTIVDEMFSADFIDHSTPEQPAGIQGVKDYFSSVRTGFPDMRITLDDLIAEGDKVVVRSTWYGTHLGTYETSPSTGKQVVRTLVQIFRIKDGKIQEEWNEGKDLLA